MGEVIYDPIFLVKDILASLVMVRGEKIDNR